MTKHEQAVSYPLPLCSRERLRRGSAESIMGKAERAGQGLLPGEGRRWRAARRMGDHQSTGSRFSRGAIRSLPMSLKLRIGSRPSRSRLRRRRIVRAALAAQIPGSRNRSRRDSHQRRQADHRVARANRRQRSLHPELEQALAAGRIDLAVHSMKDLPAVLAPRIPRWRRCPSSARIPADVLVTRDGAALAALPAGAKLGTSSSRRRFQALRVNSWTRDCLAAARQCRYASQSRRRQTASTRSSLRWPG